jgi:hypothetical protein
MAVLAGALQDRRHVLGKSDFRRRVWIGAKRYCYGHDADDRGAQAHFDLSLSPQDSFRDV